MTTDATPTACVGLLRAVNVGAHNQISMTDLKTMVRDAGGTQVATYIRSGNVVFCSDQGPEAMADAIELQIARSSHIHVDVMVRSLAQMKDIVAANPYLTANGTADLGGEPVDGTKLVVSFYKRTVAPDRFSPLNQSEFAPEQLWLRGAELYLRLPFGQGRSKLLDAISKLKLDLPCTARSWNTVLKLTAMAEKASPG